MVAEASKTSAEKHVVFNTDEWFTMPYDQNNNGSVDPEETKTFDEDDDGMLNLAEILVGGNPFNPAPTIISPASVRIPEPQTVVVTLEAISPRNAATINYNLSGGVDQTLFTLSGNTLSFISPPTFVPSGNNEFQVQITANDSTYSTVQLITVNVTDVFNLSVTIGFKQLNFTWAPLANASYYKLLQNPNGQSGFAEMPGSGNLTDLNFAQQIAVHLFDRVNAQYILEAYDVSNIRLKTSIILTITDKLLGAIGYFKASNTELYDYFGSSISLSADGNTLAVSATGEDSAAIGINDTTIGGTDNSKTTAGAVYVYTRLSNIGPWGQPDYIKAPNTDIDDYFGNSVSLSADGNTLAVGAELEDSVATSVNDITVGSSDNSAADSGAVYVYTRLNSVGPWGQPDYIKASNTEANDRFGKSVSLSADGNTLAVGAYLEDSAATWFTSATVGSNDNSTRDAGAVFVYTRESNISPWGSPTYIKASNTGVEDWFGISINLSADGNTLAVGASTEDSAATGINDTTVGSSDNSAGDAGAVYVYTRANKISSWSPPDYIKASNTDVVDLFGASVSLSADGNILAVGAEGEDSIATGVNDSIVGSDDNSILNSGAVYIYTRSNSTNTWKQQDYIKASNTEALDYFGNTVSLSADGNTLAVGAIAEDSAATGINDTLVGGGDNSADFAGAVYVYRRVNNISSWGLPIYIKAPNTEIADRFGNSISLSSDGKILSIGARGEASAAIGFNDTLVGKSDNSASLAGAVYMY